MRPQDLIGKKMYDGITDLIRDCPGWIVGTPNAAGELAVDIHPSAAGRINTEKWNDRLTMQDDMACLLAIHTWLSQGPKVFVAKPEECQAMEQVEINLLPSEYAQPYESMAVTFPSQVYSPVLGVLLTLNPVLITMDLFTEGHQFDIINTVSRLSPVPLDQRISAFEQSLIDGGVTPQSKLALRVALNICLALANYGCQHELMFPKEVERDRRLAGEKSERGAKARQRLALPAQRVTFSQEVKLHREEVRAREKGEPTGASVSTHWRRGHWAMQPHGPQQSLRKRIFRKPVLVRADLFGGELSQTSTTYRT